MNYSLMALQLALKAHSGQKDKAGKDYIKHPVYVASLLEKENEKTVAYLHDVVEDTSISLEDLKKYGFPDEIVEAIDAITKRKGESYDSYLERVSKNELARIVKIADLLHNLDLTRLDNITQEDISRKEKYQKCILKLSR